MENQEKQAPEVLELLDLDPIQVELETISSVLPTIDNIYDEDLRRDLPARLKEPTESERFVSQFDLLADLLDSSESVETLLANIEERYQAVSDRYEQNMKQVYAHTKPFEQTARGLYLLFENAGGQSNMYIMPVDEKLFVDSRTPKHFELMCQYLREQYYKFIMEDSPFYITYIGAIGGRDGMLKMAKIAEETQALAVLDISEKKSARAVLDYADNHLKITGTQAMLGHLLISGVWLNAAKAVDVGFSLDANGRIQRKEKKMSVPSAGAITGKLMGAAPGVYITGLEADPITGIDGVVVDYNMERIDSKEFAQRGLVQIIDRGHIQGGSTPNQSDKPELGKFVKVDAANALMKDIIQYCNNKAFSKWGKRYKAAFKREIENYLNRRIKAELIEGYTIEHIEYDAEEEIVDIEISIQFFEVAEEFSIGLSGAQNGINVKRED